jgi:putative heme iron utilization protein
MSNAPKKLEEIGPEVEDFLQKFKTLHLATADNNGTPTATYAPFALDENSNFIIYVSELAAHTANLFRKKPISVLLIESEQDAAHIFARKRLTYRCDIDIIARESPAFEDAMDLMQDRFGEFVEFIKNMKDFHAFRLIPKQATYVRGFAQAYELPNASIENVRHINDQGHRSEK